MLMPALNPGTFLPAALTVQRLKTTCSSFHSEDWSDHIYYFATKSNSAYGKWDNTYSGISYNNKMSQTTCITLQWFSAFQQGQGGGRGRGEVRELDAGKVIYSGHLANL